MTAREMFPLMPGEVFDAWLAPLIAKTDWPYATGRETLQVGEWPRMLLQRTPADWAGFIWNFERVEEVEKLLAESSWHIVFQLRQHALGNGDASFGSIADSENRFWQAREAFIELNGFPGFVTAYEDRGRLTVVDGHHRLAALMSFRGFETYAVPFWIARAH